MTALQIVGRKKSGKTGLIVRLIPRLREAGLAVASVKHSSHPHALDREGADSWKHREAGAEATLAVTAAAASLHFPIPGDRAEVEALVDRYLGGHDIVLIEGWAGRRGPKIELLPGDREGVPREPRFRDSGDLIAIVLSPGFRPPPALLLARGLQPPTSAAAGGGRSNDTRPEAFSSRGREPWGETRPEASRNMGRAHPPDGGVLPCFYWDPIDPIVQFVLRHCKGPARGE